MWLVSSDLFLKDGEVAKLEGRREGGRGRRELIYLKESLARRGVWVVKVGGGCREPLEGERFWREGKL